MMGYGRLTEEVVKKAEAMGRNRLPAERIALLAEVTPNTVKQWYRKGKRELEDRQEKLEKTPDADLGELSLFAKFYKAYMGGNLDYMDKIIGGIEEANIKGKWQAGQMLLEGRHKMVDQFAKEADKLDVNLNSTYADNDRSELKDILMKKLEVSKG